jgi:flagellar basal body-associated protein FliL
MSTSSYTIVIDEGPLKGRRYPVTPAGLRLGRSSQCDIAITDLLLSRSHCRFELRDNDLWLTDLASANQTLVNDQAITEQKLTARDIIKVGQSVLHVETAVDGVPVPTAAPADSGASSPETAANSDVVIDLGFGKSEAALPQKKSVIRPILWTIVALLVLLAGATLILDPGNRAKFVQQAKPATIEEAKSPQIYYEKVEATAENIFRYEMTISVSGLLSVKIDDLSGKNRFVRKEKQVDPALLNELAHDIESSGFFALDKAYTGFAAKPNTLNEWTLTCVIGKKVHTCHISNRQEPDNFRALREKLETFSKNELGIWAIQFSSDKLSELARNALNIAKKKFDDRDVKYGNVFEAIRSYREAVFYLDTVNPKPDFYSEIIDGFEAAQTELDKRYDEQRFRADRAINLADWPAADRELKILCEIVPDRADARNKEASRKLLDVEKRLTQKHHR